MSKKKKKNLSGRKANCINDQMTCRSQLFRQAPAAKIKCFLIKTHKSGPKLLVQRQLVCLFFHFYHSIFQTVWLCPLFICLYAPRPVCIFIFSAVFLSIHQSCSGLFEVTELSILVISGCHHKGLRATSWNSQKAPCIPTKKPFVM